MWKWLIIGIIVLTVAGLLGWWIWSLTQPKASAQQREEKREEEEVSPLPNARQPISTTPSSTTTELTIATPEGLITLPLNTETGQLFTKTITEPVYDPVNDSWLLIDQEGAHIAAYENGEYPIRVTQRIPVVDFDGVSISFAHAAIVFATSGAKLFFQGDDHGLGEYDEIDIVQGYTTTVILSDHTLILLNEEKRQLYEVTLPAGVVNPLSMESIHTPQRILPFPDSDALLVVDGERSFHIQADQEFEQVAVYPHACTSFSASEDLLFLGNHVKEEIYIYKRFTQERLNTVTVPGGSHIQRFPPSGFGYRVQYIVNSGLLMVSAPYQHSHREEQRGMIYIFFVSEDGDSTPCRILQSTNPSSHFGIVMVHTEHAFWVGEVLSNGLYQINKYI